MEVRSLMVTLRRSLAGRPHFHKRILDALGLHTRHQCVERPNNESIRGMLEKVSHLVIVETDRMFYLKRMRDYHQQCMREPIAVSHGEAVAAANACQSQTPTASPSLTSPRTLPASVRASLPLELQQQPLPPLHPAHSVLVAPHMHEHMQPLPSKSKKAGAPSDDQADSPSAAAARLPSLASVLDKLLKKRSQLLQGRPEMLYDEQVLSLNKAIMETREKQYQQEVALRLHAIKVRQILGNRTLPTMPGKGKGGRRGLLDSTKAALNQAASGNRGGEASSLGQKQQDLSSSTTS